MPRQQRMVPVTVESLCVQCKKRSSSCWRPNHTVEEVKVELDYDTKVVLLDPSTDERVSSRVAFPSHWGKPEEDFDIRPYRLYHKKTHFNGEPSHYELVNPKDMTYDHEGWFWSRPNPWSTEKQAVKVFHKVGDPHPYAGQLVCRAPVKTLGSLPVGAFVLFKDDQGNWKSGHVGAFESYRSVRRQVEQASRKRRKARLKMLARMSIWEMLEDTV